MRQVVIAKFEVPQRVCPICSGNNSYEWCDSDVQDGPFWHCEDCGYNEDKPHPFFPYRQKEH